MFFPRFNLVALFCFVSLLSITRSHAQPPCYDLKPDENEIVQYRERGSRCEGLYITDVSSNNINIVSFTKGKFDYKFDPKELITLKSAIKTDEEINIRAEGIPVALYYRMDAKLSSSIHELIWPVKDVIYEALIKPGQIGVYAWVKRGSKKRYIPIIAKTKLTNSKSDEVFRVVFRSSVHVEDVHYRFWDSNIRSSWNQINIDWVKIANRHTEYKQGEGIIFTLPKNIPKEITFEIIAKEKGSLNWINLDVLLVLEK